MGVKSSSFKKKLLATSISSCLLASAGAVTAQEVAEEVIVLGVRGAQESAINLKRDAASVVDGIVAEDIGKLPDVTIADSLQRIPGIQISRSAGEGGSINVRGLPQVVTHLNGEVYLGAGSINTIQPDFGDIPSQLFAGADVHKSPTANLVTSGISGTVNLKTRRPFDMDEGVTSAAGFELQTGAESREMDPVVSGLVNWRNDRVGFLLSGAFANVNLANFYNGTNTGDPSGDIGWVNTVNDWGAAQDFESASHQGVAAWNQVTERERLGLNGSFQADIGEGFEFIADFFYTNQDEYNRKVGVSATNKWQGLNWYNPSISHPTGVAGPHGREWAVVEEYQLDTRRLKSFTQNDSFLSDSRNVNLELNYDNGGPFTASARAVFSEANRKRRHGYNEGDMTDGSTTGINPFYPASECREGIDDPIGDEGGCFRSPNPLGYSENPQITWNTQGEHPVWSGFDAPLAGGLAAGSTVADYMGNLDSYNIGAFSSENNADSRGKVNVFRVDGSYEFTDQPFITSVDAGIRTSRRSVSEERFHLFSPFYEEGCLVQWKATDVVLDSGPCQAGEIIPHPNAGEPILDEDEMDTGEVYPATRFQGYTALPPTALDEHNNVLFVTDFGPVQGIPGVWAVDPRDYDDPEAFHNRVFGSTERAVIPGTSYEVDINTITFYAQANFEYGIMSGNFGVRHVETELLVKQNETGEDRPYGNTQVDVGDQLTRRTYTDILPSLNMAFDVAENVKLRVAASKNMVPLDLNNWGDGLSVSTSLDEELGIFVVNSASMNGNPNLNPWRSTNFDASAEWYVGSASMLSVGAFYIEIDSFVRSDTVPMELPDTDGVVRRTIDVSTNVQGDGGELKGVELAARLALNDFIDTPVLSDFGVDMNYTYSPSQQSARDVEGNKYAFPDNSENQVNFIAWYQAERFQARVAFNYRDDRLVSQGHMGGLGLYQKPTFYVDMSASYDVTDNVTVYVNGSNILQEYEDYYIQWENQLAYQNYYEPRYTLGVRARF